MQSTDVLIVGGGPAGASCAWRLRGAGLEVLVVDKAVFPRDKLCAGWITPPVLEELAIDPAEYGRGRVLQPLTGFRTGLIGGRQLHIDYGRPVSYGIRRAEFDHYLLQRCGARLELGQPVQSLQFAGGSWIVNERFAARMLVGAGGHFCPVARQRVRDTRHEDRLFVTQEIEFALTERQAAACRVDPQVPEVYFCRDLLGYGWCFRKGDFLNIGLGREDRRNLPQQARAFREYLRQCGRIPVDTPERFGGHVYLPYDASPRPLVDDGLLLVGDAAGMASATSGEGIRPAVESGLLAAEAIRAAAGRYDRHRLAQYEKRVYERFGRNRGPAKNRMLSGCRQRLGRLLLNSRWFTRRVVLDRWFLHRHEGPLPPAPG